MKAKKQAIFNDDYDEEDDYAGIRSAISKKQEFEEVEQTSEYMETHYYNHTDLNTKNLIPMSQFWADYANYLLKPL